MQQDLVKWLLSHYGQEHMRPGLDRMREALKTLIPAFKNTKIVTIAGTNGKGETTLRLSRLLKNESHAVWTSPHIERITERFRNERGEITYAELETIIHECHEKVKKHGYELSFYEFLFFVFCSWAAKSSPKFLLLEVGLGGRLDAVNVLDAHLVLLPSISRDHQEFLGARYDGILLEKLGTLRKNSTLISFLHLDYLRERTAHYCKAIGAQFHDLEALHSLPEFEFSLRNQLLASAAFLVLHDLPITLSVSEESTSSLEHRGEIIHGQNEWLFFGSHNTDGMRKLIQFLHSGNYTFSRPPFDSVIVAFSHRNVRDLSVMMRMLKTSGLGKIVVTTFPHPKAEASQVVEALSREEGLDFVQDIKSYVESFKNKRVLITGSYYFIGHFKSSFCRH